MNSPVLEAAVESSTKLSIERKPGELLTPLTAIRSCCLGCCSGSPKEVALCLATDCPLWPHRFRDRTRARKIVAEERQTPGLIGSHWAEKLSDFTGQVYYKRHRSLQIAAERRERGV